MTHSMTRAFQASSACLLVWAIAATGPTHHARPWASHTAGIIRTIALSLPYREYKTLAVGVEHGVRVAVSQANAQRLVPGVTFAVSTLDDSANRQPDGAIDVRNARRFVIDPSVIGVVGPLDANAAATALPIFRANGLVQLSLANTMAIDPAVAGQLRPVAAPGTYFRVCAGEESQGQEAALYTREAGLKRVLVVDNQGSYGISLTKSFIAKARVIGLRVVGYAELDRKNIAASAQSLALVATTLKPQLVYFGGEYGPTGGADALANALRRDGMRKIVFVGGDRIETTDFINRSTATAALGALATVTGINPRKNAVARALLQAEAHMFPHVAATAYDACAYDTAQIILRSFARAVKSGKLGARAPLSRTARLLIARNVAATKGYRGATGTVTFTKNGDTTATAVSVYKVTGAGRLVNWTFLSVAPHP